MNQLRPRARATADDDVEEQQQAMAMPEVAARLDRGMATATFVCERRGGGCSQDKGESYPGGQGNKR